MALQGSGAISINNINVELGKAGTTTSSLGQADFRTLAGVPSGAISMSNFYGKSNIKTGNYYNMTSATTPSPFVVSDFSSGAYNFGLSPYNIFDSDNVSAYYANTTVSGHYFGGQLTFNNSITVRKVYFKGANAAEGNSNQGNFKVDLLVSGAWTSILDYNVGAGGGYDGIITVNYANVTAIRCRWVYGSGDTSAYGGLFSCKVTEWI